MPDPRNDPSETRPAEGIRFERAPRGHFPGFDAGLTERSGGESGSLYRSLNLSHSVADDPCRVEANEAGVLRSLGLTHPVARLRLEHGSRIVTVSSGGIYGPADAILTEREDLVLWLTVADCYPVAISSGKGTGDGPGARTGTIRALVHCGWRSIAAGILEGVLEQIGRVEPHRIDRVRVWIGPGVGVCCYEVGNEVADQFAPDSLRTSQDGTRPSLDLPAEIRRRLSRKGVPREAIASSGQCTACSPARYFSHRRDGYPTGRMAALFWPDRSDGDSITLW